MRLKTLPKLVCLGGVILGLCIGCVGPSQQGASTQPGAVLRYGTVSAGGAPTTDPHGKLFSESDWQRLSAIYDTLTVLGDDGRAAPRLATSWTANGDATEWTFVLREATFSDGSKVTAEDALYSIGRLQNKAADNGARISAIDMTRSKVLNASTLLLVTPKPDADLPRTLTLGSFVVKKGTTDFSAPIGSGPFVLNDLDEQVAQLTANDSWWGGRPGVRRVEIRGFTDPQAMAQAVTGGSIDLASGVQPSAAKASKGSDVVVTTRPGAETVPLLLRVNTAPFNRPQVREAVKLALDRPALVEQIYLGYGTVGKDMIRLNDPEVPDLPEITRDVERAKQLLAQAGYPEGFTVKLHTSNAYPAMVPLATAVKEQLAKVRITVEVQEHPADRYWTTAYGVEPFTMGYYGGAATFGSLVRATVLSTAAYSETGWKDAAFDAAYAKAMTTTDDAARRGLLGALHQRMAREGGWVVWGFGDRVMLHRGTVHGVPTSGSPYDLSGITVDG